MAVIDFHTHVLPGMDDGSKDADMSVEMLKMAALQGVDVMIATPHFYAMHHRPETSLERRQKAFSRLEGRLTEQMPRILAGAEVAFFPGISQAKRLDELTIEGTNVLLLEMPFSDWTNRDLEEVGELIKTRHYKIVLAHLERYMKISGNRKRFEELFSMPLYVQINAGSLTRWQQKRTLVKMFEKGQAHFLGSDCHGITYRSPNLSQGREILEKKLGGEFLRRMDQIGSSLLQLEG